MRTIALIVLTCLALTACGGDDSSSSPAQAGNGAESTNNGRIGGSDGSGNSTLTLRYDALPTAADQASFLTLINNEGAKGYRYLGDYFYDASNGGSQSIFVNDGAAQTYTYQLQATPTSMTGFVSQANAQGTSGYRFEGPLTYGYLYRKDGGSSATYTYTTTDLSTDPDAFVAQANGEGQSGYWFLGPMVAGSEQANVYMKDNASNATYTYDVVMPTSTVGDFITQANSEGAKGYRSKGKMQFGPLQPTGAINLSWIYMKDQTQSATFTYQSAAVQATGASFVQQLNTFGAQGNAYLGDLPLGMPSPTASFYFEASNCTGFLCTTLNPLTQN
ncbi:hypothetical protein DIE11_06555 [Burkholderia sp. Bp9012]|uniref:hypothetical protein n=1 Tax=Burkholderia sp. Bp9012 TaxID=2184562 RepID=UPI000F58FB74|nr:hypothetical protein [Burkholderia sp. Bp9012]RQR84335.1 hypothetical protein DIE11_06555 [Burkholderia sp. Bp9012]